MRTFFTWLWKNRKKFKINLKERSITFTTEIERTGAEDDVCALCPVRRKNHEYLIQHHHFTEKGETA